MSHVPALQRFVALCLSAAILFLLVQYAGRL